MDNVWIVIAAYNEERSISGVISDLIDKGYKNVIVVDDGSVDKTYELASKAGAFVLKHCINRGQGAALQTGIEYALGKDADFIVTFDADGQHAVEDIPRILAPVKSGGYDVSLGSRFIKQSSNVPFMRKVFLKGGALLMWIFYGIKVTDSHNGFRAFSSYAAERIKIDCDRMEHASEIIDKIGRADLKYCEVPVTIQYTDYSRQKGQSTLNAFKIFYRMVVNKFR